MFGDGTPFDDEDFEEEEEGTDPVETVEAFLETWAEQDFDAAYGFLASNSPLRNGLTHEEWINSRNEWAKQAVPAEVKFNVIYDDLEEDDEDEEDEEQDDVSETDETADTAFEVEVFWSLEMSKTPLDDSIQEPPLATLSYPETRRHWFWASYKLVEEEDELRIFDMVDEGALSLNLSVEDLTQDIEVLTTEIESIAQSIGADLTDEEDEGEKEEDEDKEDDEDLIFGLNDPESILEDLTRVATRALHYSDALIALSPLETQFYERATTMAALLQEWERAAAYVTLLSERFPEQRGETLSSLAVILSTLVAQYEQEGVLDRAEQFTQLIEKTLRDAITNDDNFTARILLSDLLIDQGEEQRLEEVETLLNAAQQKASNDTEKAQVANGLGRLAEAQDDLQTALNYYQQASQLDPQLPDIWISLGDTYSKLNQLAEAEQSYRRAIEVNPEESYPYVELASIYTSRSDFPAAHRILDQGTAASDNPDLLASRAIVFIYQNDLKSAEEVLTEAEELAPELELVIGARILLDSRRAQQRQSGSKSNTGKPKNKKR